MDTSLSVERSRLQTQSPQAVPTWGLVTALILLELVIAWSTAQIALTPEVMQAAAGGPVDPLQVERMLHTAERFQWVGYVFVVPSVLVRLSLVALVLQLTVLLLDGIPVPFGTVMRAGALGHFAAVVQNFLGVVWLSRLDGPEQATMFLKGSAFSLGMLVDRDGSPGVISALAPYVSIADVAWILLVAWAIASALSKPRWSMVGTCAFAWCAITVLRFALVETLRTLRS